ncbi:MAG: tetratricopeptide repeat protein [Chitinophagales bacterium]
MSEYKKTTPETKIEDPGTYKNVEDFFLKNRNIIIGVLGVIVLAIGGYFGYKKLYMEPRVLTAEKAIGGAEGYFMKDSLDYALNGDGATAGFLTVIDKYGNTPSGNIAKYYAGTIYLKKGDLDNAIKYLEDFKPPVDEVAGKTYENLGHAYADKKNYTKAIEYYKKAGEAANNNLQSPTYYKYAGDLMSDQGDLKGALEMYRKIKKEYPLSQEGSTIDIEISYAETKLGE